MHDNKNNSMTSIRKLRLAYIIGTHPTLSTTFIDREIKTLHEMGVSIQILSIRRPGPHAALTEKYSQMKESIIYLLPVDWIKFTAAHLYFILFRPIAYFTLLLFLFTRPHRSLKLRLKTLLHFAEGVYAAYLLQNLDWDHIHAHFLDRAATVALCVSRLLRVSYSLAAHAVDIYVQPVLIPEKIGEAKFTVTDSEFNRVYLLKHYPELNPDKIFAHHPWIDLSQFRLTGTRTDHPRLRIMSVGRLVEKKGHHYLIEACHLLQKEGVDFECRILGDGPLKSELEEMITRYNLTQQVYLLGGQPQEEVLAQLSQSDVFVLACVVAKNGDRDGMPVSLAEAMAMEIPVISTDLVGIGEMIRPEAGYLVPPEDPAALAEAIKAMNLIGPSKRIEMGKYGRTIIAQDFELFKGIHRLADLFLEAIAEKDVKTSPVVQAKPMS